MYGFDEDDYGYGGEEDLGLNQEDIKLLDKILKDLPEEEVDVLLQISMEDEELEEEVVSEVK